MQLLAVPSSKLSVRVLDFYCQWHKLEGGIHSNFSGSCILWMKVERLLQLQIWRGFHVLFCLFFFFKYVSTWHSNCYSSVLSDLAAWLELIKTPKTLGEFLRGCGGWNVGKEEREEQIKDFKGNSLRETENRNSKHDFFANSKTLDKVLGVRTLFSVKNYLTFNNTTIPYINLVWSIIPIRRVLQSKIYLCNRK